MDRKWQWHGRAMWHGQTVLNFCPLQAIQGFFIFGSMDMARSCLVARADRAKYLFSFEGCAKEGWS